MKEWIEGKWDFSFLDLKLRIQDSMERFHCISVKIIEMKKSTLGENDELRNIYFDRFENIAVELSHLWNEVMDIEESKKQELFIMIYFHIKDLPCTFKQYAIERLALNVLWEIFRCTDFVRKVLLINDTKKDS